MTFGLGALSLFYLLIALFTLASLFLFRGVSSILALGRELQPPLSMALWFLLIIAPGFLAVGIKKRRRAILPLAVIYQSLFLANSLLLFIGCAFPKFFFPPIIEIAAKRRDVFSILPEWAIFAKKTFFILSVVVSALVIRYLILKRSLFK